MSGGKGGGGSSDAKYAVQYGNMALDLQKDIYKNALQQNKPFQEVGLSGLDRLSYLLGLNGPSQSSVDGALNAGTTPNAGTPAATTTQTGSTQKYIPGYRGSAGGYVTIPTTTTTPVAATPMETTPVQAANPNDPQFGSLTRSYDGSTLADDPSYKFRYDQGQKAAERQLSASGQYLAPAATKALQEYGQGMASQEYNNAYNRYTNDQNNLFNRLAAITGIGQTATNSNVNAGSQYGSQGSETLTGIGNSLTGANLAQNSNSNSLFGNLLNAGANGAALWARLSDIRLKENITPMGEENGYKIYEYNYIGDPQRYIGVMAQEVMQTYPDAVVVTPTGHYAVNYDKIGVKFRAA